MRLKTHALIGVLALLLVFPVVAQARTNVRVGIADQNQAMFDAPAYRALHLKTTRFFIRWDAIRYPAEMARAEAYVRSKTDDGVYAFYWKESCVPVTIYLNGFDRTSGMTLTQIVKSVTAAAHTWSADAISCASGDVTTSPYLEIVPTLAPAAQTPPRATDSLVSGSWDARNSIIFRTESWSNSGKPGHDYPFEALAVTTVTARLDGHVVDADLEVNGVNKTWMNLDPGVSVPFDHGATAEVFDLQNTLTHEFGHFIGLDHTCFVPSANGTPRPKDDKGNDVPDCDSAPVVVQNTVMFNRAQAGETSKRALAPDDARAVCEIYAPSLEHLACALDSANPGCAVAAAAPTRHASRASRLGLPLGALAMLAAVAARRRRRRVTARRRARA